MEPRFGGQKFMIDMMPKVNHLRTKDIEEDGGIGIPTIEAASQTTGGIRTSCLIVSLK